MGCARCGIVEITMAPSDGFPTLLSLLTMCLGQWQPHAHVRTPSSERYCTRDASADMGGLRDQMDVCVFAMPWIRMHRGDVSTILSRAYSHCRVL